MNWKRIFRAAVCLLVVCCLVCNYALPRSQATGVELIVGTAISVAAVSVIGSMLVGLGVSPGSDQTVFDDLVNGAVDMFTEAGKVVGGMMSIWSLTNSSVKYAVEPEIIEMLREWIQGLGILSEKTVSLAAGYSRYGNWSYYSIPASFLTPDLPYIIIGRTYHDNEYRLIFSSKPLFVGSKYSNYYSFLCFGCDAGTSIKQCTVDTSLANKWVEGSVYTKDSQSPGTTSNLVVAIASSEFQSNFWSNYDIYGTSAYNSGALIFEGTEAITESGTYVTLADDYTAGYIAPSADSLTDGYADWAANSITLPGSEADDVEIPVFPLGLGVDYLDTISKTQTDVWIGTSEYTISDTVIDTDIEPITGTFADTAVGTFIDTFVDALTAPLQWLADLVVSGVKALFIPAEGVLEAKLNSLTSEFSFADSLFRTGLDLKEFILNLGSQPPIIYIDLSSARGDFSSDGKYTLGGKAIFLDLTWYAEYKPTVDNILSAFIWLWFVWRMLIMLPSVFQGSSGLIGVGSVDDSRFDSIHTWKGFTFQTKSQYDSAHMRFNLNKMKWGR